MSQSTITILNGPNLNLLGEREPEIYGSTTLAEVEDKCREYARSIDVTLRFKQTNHEGVLVDWIQEERKTSDALIINPAGFTFYSIAIHDAMKIYKGPIIELHISNIHARDDLHQNSKLSVAATGVICGLGVYGYIVAMQAANQMISEKESIK